MSRLGKPFQEVWFFKLNHPTRPQALWLRWTLLTSENGFRKTAEVWAILFNRTESETQKTALKQSFEISQFLVKPGGSIQIGSSELAPTSTVGKVEGMGKTLSWNLQFKPRTETTVSFSLVPEALQRAGIAKNEAIAVHEDLLATGTCELNGVRFEWDHAVAMLGHITGPRNGHSWVWAHCNQFQDESGKPSDVLFDGITGRARVPVIGKTPALSTFLFRYRGDVYRFDTVWDALRARSVLSTMGWSFQADRGDLSFRGQIRSEARDFAGVTYEDTDGTFLYCSNTKLAAMDLQIYRSGKLEASYRSPHGAAFEIVSRSKNPYVPLMI